MPAGNPDARYWQVRAVAPQFADPVGNEIIRIYDVELRQFSTVPESTGLWTARWSRDKRYLAALTTDTDQRLKVFDFETRQWRALPADHVDNPTWSHDGQFIYYDTQGLIRALRRVRVADGTVDTLFDLEHYPVAAYWWSGLTPDDDSPVILRNLGAPEVYALQLQRR
jgi:hypothetical protein